MNENNEENDISKEEGNDISNNFELQFLYAAKNGHLQRAERLLLDGNYDPSVDDNAVIKWAAENGHHNVIYVLLKDKRVDPTTNSNYPIQIATLNNHIKVVEYLLNDTRVNPIKAFYTAAECGHLDIIKLLVKDDRIDLNYKDPDTQLTALQISMNNDYLEQSEFLLTIGKSITEKSSKRTLVESDQRQNLQFILNAVTEQHEHENDKLTNVQLNILQHQNISDDDNQNEFIEDEMTVRSSSPTPFTPATDISQTQQLDNAIRLSQKRSFHNINSQTQESIRLSQKKSFPNGNSQSQQFDNAIRLSQTQSIHNNSTVKTTDKQNVEVQNTGTEFTKDHNSNTNDENSSHYNCQEQKNDSGDKKQLPQSTTNTDCNQLHVQSQEIPSEMMTLITKTPSANLPGSIVTSPPVQIDDQLKSKQLDHGIPELNSNTTAIGQEPFEYIEMKECKPKPISDINTMGRTNVIDSTITDNSLLQIQKIPEPNVVVEKILTEEILLQLINQRFTISQYQFTTELKQHIPIDITKCKISSQTFNHSLQLLLQRTPKMARHPQHGQTYTFTLELLQIGEQLGGIPISIETFKKSKSYHSFIKRLYRFLVGSGDTKSPMKYIRQYRDKHK